VTTGIVVYLRLQEIRETDMKKLLAKYGRHFWIISLAITIFATYDFFYNEGSFFDILMLSALTLLFYWQGQGKLEEE
jgi:hypothetical protein